MTVFAMRLLTRLIKVVPFPHKRSNCIDLVNYYTHLDWQWIQVFKKLKKLFKTLTVKQCIFFFLIQFNGLLYNPSFNN